MKLNNKNLSKVENDIEFENQVESSIQHGKIGNFFYTLYKYTFKRVKAVRLVMLWYLLITLTGALLLWAPFSQKSGVDVAFIDALFMAASGFSNTGLVTVGVYDSFNGFGQAVLFTLFQLGGIGWFAIKIFILSFLLRKIRTKTIDEAQEEIGTTGKKETIGIVKVAVITTLSMTLIMGIVFGTIFATVGYSLNPKDVVDESSLDVLKGNWSKSLWTGFFHAGSSINNAGLDVIPGNYSLQPYFSNYGIQILTLFLFVLGGIGFGVIYDIKEYIKYRSTGRKFNFSLLTKVSTIAYLVVSLSGLGLTYMSEGINASYNSDAFLNNNDYGTVGQRWWALTFNTFSTRNAGFSTVDLDAASSGTKGIWAVMMFIGSGPGSTAGGLRTTTLAVLIIAIWSRARNKPSSSAFNRTIPQKTVSDAFVIFVSAVMLVILSTVLISIAESSRLSDPASGVAFLDIWFVVNSAFGTTGLSTMVHTFEAAHIWTKLNIIIIMFIGQIGILTTLRNMSFGTIKEHKSKYQRYIEENINIGH